MKRFILFLSTLLGLLVACGGRPGTSEIHHNVSEPLREAESALWLDMSRESYGALAGAGITYLDASSPAVLRAQNWVDRMFAYWMHRFPSEVDRLPRPLVMVEKRGGMNAAVNIRLKCFPVRFDSHSEFSLNKRDAAVVRLYANLGSEIQFLDGVTISDRLCDSQNSDVSDLERYIHVLNRQLALEESNRCRFELVDGVLRGTASCHWRQEAEFQGAGTVAVPMTTNIVSLFAGSYLKLSEPELVAMLAHEMGHFFKADASRPRRSSGFFYELGPANFPFRPRQTNDPHLRVLGKVLTELNTVQIYPELVGQQLHPNVLFDLTTRDVYQESRWFTDYVQDFCTGKSCEQACGAFTAHWESGTTQTAIHRNGYPSADGAFLGGNDLAIYRDVENSLRRCAEQIDTQSPFAGSFDARVYVRKLLAQDIFRVTGSALLGPYESLWSVLQDASYAYRLAADWVRQGQEAVRSHNLGWYTYEQEADEFALEQLQALGFPPESHVSLLWKFLDDSNIGVTGTNDISNEACREAAARGWQNPDGTPQFIPLGAWGDPHHGNCYRIFNATREIAAHRYGSVALPPIVQPDGPTWNEAVTSVRMALGTRP